MGNRRQGLTEFIAGVLALGFLIAPRVFADRSDENRLIPGEITDILVREEDGSALELPLEVTHFELSEDGLRAGMVVVEYGSRVDPWVRVMDVESGSEISGFRISEVLDSTELDWELTGGYWPEEFRFSPDGEQFLMSFEQGAVLFEKDGKVVHQETGRVSEIAFSGDGSRFAYISWADMNTTEGATLEVRGSRLGEMIGGGGLGENTGPLALNGSGTRGWILATGDRSGGRVSGLGRFWVEDFSIEPLGLMPISPTDAPLPLDDGFVIVGSAVSGSSGVYFFEPAPRVDPEPKGRLMELAVGGPDDFFRVGHWPHQPGMFWVASRPGASAVRIMVSGSGRDSCQLVLDGENRVGDVSFFRGAGSRGNGKIVRVGSGRRDLDALSHEEPRFMPPRIQSFSIAP